MIPPALFVIIALADARAVELNAENATLRAWLGARLPYESGLRRKLYLRPDGKPDKRHFGTSDEAINAALVDAKTASA